MKIEDSRALLAEYVAHGTESAFRDLVGRYIDLVYSTALRLLRGDKHLAEDVSQTVFAALARKAPTLTKRAMLGGWLHRHTCYVAATVRRTERRRQWRERQATQMNAMQDKAADIADVAAILDEAINELGAKDRTAIVLRFFEQLDLRSVGEALGSSEDAAQKRVSRALEKLRCFLTRRDITLSTAALGTALAANAVAAAPAGLGTSVAEVALGEAAVSGGVLTFLKTMNIAHLKLGALTTVAIAVAAVPLTIQHRVLAQLREEDRALRRQVLHLAEADTESQRLSNLLAQAKSTPTLPDEQFRELLRLRGEVALLRKRMQDVGQSRTATPPSATSAPKQSEVTRIEVKYAGPRLVAEDVIRTNILMSTGQPFQQAIVDTDVRTLYATRLFSDIRVRDEVTSNGTVVTYTVQCRPRLTDLKFKGNTRFSDAQLQALITSSIGLVLDEKQLFTDSQAIRSDYHQIGFTATRVTYVLQIDERSGNGGVTFEITESP